MNDDDWTTDSISLYKRIWAWALLIFAALSCAPLTLIFISVVLKSIRADSEGGYILENIVKLSIMMSPIFIVTLYKMKISFKLAD